MTQTQQELQAQSFHLLAVQSPDLVREVFEANLDGVVPEFVRIKIPSGGGIAFEVPNEEGEPEARQEIVGVVIDHHAANAYWVNKFSGQNNAPDCSSLDGKIGTATPESGLPWAGGTNACATCPYNQFGSDPSGGKACKNMHRLFILPEGEMFPLVLTLPPTSIRPWTAYVTRLASRLKPVYSVVTKIKLKREQNKTGIAYSQAVFTKAGDLSPTEVESIKQYIATLKPHMRRMTVEGDDYNTTGPSQSAAQANGATADLDNEDLPF